MASVYLIDPTEGWNYGFPKTIPATAKKSVLEDLNGWLLANGYPQEMIDLQNGNVRCRIVGPFDEPDEER